MNHDLIARMDVLAKRIIDVDGLLPIIERAHDKSEWAAWRRWRMDNDLPVNFMDKRERFTVLTKYPPADLADLEQQYAGTGRTNRKLRA